MKVPFILYFGLGHIYAKPTYGDFTNVNCIRTISLKEPQQVKESISVVIQNTGSDKADKYFFHIPKVKNNSMAAMVVQTKAEKIMLPISLENFDEKKKLQYYSVNLSPPLRSEGKVVFNFEFIFLHSVHPYPETVTQTQAANYKYVDNIHFSTPYPSTAQKTVVKLATSTLVDYTRDVSSTGLKDKTLTYGPYSDLPAYPEKELMVHFPHTDPISYVRTLFRGLHVSTWWNSLSVEEHFAIDNYSPRFKGASLGLCMPC